MPNEQGVFESAVFTIPAPLRFAGGWRMAEPLAGLTPDSLAERRGCAVYLRREKDGVYRGGTIGDGCASELDGATHATSEVVIERGRMRTLDRGFDAENRQVWGSKSGPYVFDRLPEPRRR